jgi:hypothetical protein
MRRELRSPGRSSDQRLGSGRRAKFKTSNEISALGLFEAFVRVETGKRSDRVTELGELVA